MMLKSFMAGPRKIGQGRGGRAIDRFEKERWGRKDDFNVANLSKDMKSVVSVHSAIYLTAMRKISRGGECEYN